MSEPLAPSSPLRVLAPGGGFSSPRTILRTRAEIRKEQDVKQEYDAFEAAKITLRGLLEASGRSISIQSSGSQSLWQIFQHHVSPSGPKVVGIPAYTCPDIAVAAAKAGWKVLPLDIDPQTLDVASEQYRFLEQQKISAIVLPNLYGMVDALAPWESGSSLLRVDDACQAALSTRDGVSIGFAPETFGVLSFGRGKAYCGPSGGAMVYSATESGEIEIPEAGKDSNLVDTLYGTLMWLAERPSIYGLPARMPGLGLGETKCDFEFIKDSVSESALLHAIAQVKSSADRQAQYRHRAKIYSEELANLNLILPAENREFANESTLIRYPVVLPSNEIREKLYHALWRLGVSRSYCSSLYSFAALQPYLLENSVPVAEDLSGRILSLPVHIYVRDADIAMIVSYLRKVLR